MKTQQFNGVLVNILCYVSKPIAAAKDTNVVSVKKFNHVENEAIYREGNQLNKHNAHLKQTTIFKRTRAKSMFTVINYGDLKIIFEIKGAMKIREAD